MKNKILNAMIILIVVALYISVFMFIYSNFRERKRQEVSDKIIQKVDEEIEKNKNSQVVAEEINTTYNGINYTVLGKIKIKKININEPILKENTAKAYNTSVVKISGPSINSTGNVIIGGHNFMKGNFFIKINRLVENDVITITDLKGESIDYYVYEYKVVSADDASYLKQPIDGRKMITLVTCTKGGKDRYIVKAKAK